MSEQAPPRPGDAGPAGSSSPAVGSAPVRRAARGKAGPARTSPVRTGRARSAPARRPPTRVGRMIRKVRGSGKDWLDRPMTSWHLILAVFVLLLGFGLLMVLSASAMISLRSRTGSAFSTFGNQAVFAVIGLAGFVFAARVSTRYLRTLAFPAVLIAIALLAAVLAIGRKLNGARSWIGFGSASFQPSELAKVALLIWMAHVLAARRKDIRSLKALLFPVLPVFALMVVLIMRQPDLGTTVSLAIVFFAVLWFAGAPLWIFGLLTAGGIAGVVYLSFSAPYRIARMKAFMHPFDEKFSTENYQLLQGFYGMGHGGLFGAGLGQSMIKWSWLPNADSDFIFAVIGEELGLIGTGLVLLLYGLLAYTGLRIARRSLEPFNRIVAAAGTVWLVGQAAINIGYVVGLLPVTGIPLPMISAGGTSLVVTMLVFGLLANLARREPQAAAALYAQGPGRVARFLGVAVQRPGEPRPQSARRQRRIARTALKTAERAERAELRRVKAAERAARTEAADRAARASRAARSRQGSRSDRDDPRAPGARRGSSSHRSGASRRPARPRVEQPPPRGARGGPPPLRRDGDRPSRLADEQLRTAARAGSRRREASADGRSTEDRRSPGRSTDGRTAVGRGERRVDQGPGDQGPRQPWREGGTVRR